MKLESVAQAHFTPAPQHSPVEAVAQPRKESLSLAEPARHERKVSPEEVLDKIKALTEDGQYSVRFEKNDDADKLVIKLVDSHTGELIRQIPSEELLGSAKFLHDLRGSMINTES